MKITEFTKTSLTLSEVSGYGVALFLLSIYFSTALAIVLSAVLALLWLASGQYKQLANTLKNNPVALWSLLLFACFLFGSHYGNASRSDGLTMLRKYRELLFIPLLLPFLAEARYRQWAWLAFMVASLVTVLGSQLMEIHLFCVNPQCLPYFKGYITHGILIAFFAFFIMHKAFDNRGLRQLLYLAVLLMCLYNLFFIAAGRTGQLIFISLSVLFALQRFSKKGVLFAVLIIAIFLGGFVSLSDKASRIKEGAATMQSYLHGQTQEGEFSMGERFTFWSYSAKLIVKKPILGHGTGNFAHAYKNISGKNANNPHNEFLLITEQLGIVGLVFYLGFLSSQYVYAKTLPTQDKWLAQGVLMTLVVSSLFNSPFLDHTEGHWFATMIALCFASRVRNAYPTTTTDFKH